ncbi:MAG: hypothetical protein M1821_000121 [Bathelium mastoideum]|nr:MAG: hypothetical protein M1821_000121 [Bathelium mastoideum]
MAEEVHATSIQERIAALKLNQVVGPPESPPPSYELSVTAKKARAPPPPLPTKRPPPDVRRASANNPPLQSNAPASSNTIGNQPAVLPAPQMQDLRLDPSMKSRTPNIPSRPSRRTSEQTPVLPPRTNTAPSPALPPRTNTSNSPSLPPQTNTTQSPSLPPRRPSEQVTRRGSSESVSSTISALSSVSGISSKTARTSIPQASEATSNRIKAPEYDPASLPLLPPKKQKDDVRFTGRAPLKPTNSSPSVLPAAVSVSNASKRNLPPPLPVRGESRAEQNSPQQPALPKRSALSFGMNTETSPPLPGERPKSITSDPVGIPPPVPLPSRPNLAALQASKPRLPIAPTSDVCLKCRDFSAADNHATRFPRSSLPSTDIAWLAQHLTAPFSSPTDQARCIFTWLHHNISYNVDAFFSHTVKPSTPASTLQSGLAVCEGYAGLFTALATHAGLQSLVIGGHGKGYGHTALAAGAPCPPQSSGHAWNAVFLPDSGTPGEWKLLDCCWGAGVVQGPGQPYRPLFNPAQFTMDNDDFGASHFPSDRGRQYRADGREISWEEYILSDAGPNAPPQYFDGYIEPEGLRRASIEPCTRDIPASRAMSCHHTRFRFGMVCPHWTAARNGPGPAYVFVLKAPGLGDPSKMRDFMALDTDGRQWWAEVQTQRLGKPGDSVELFAVTSWDGRDGRGVSVEEFRRRQGTVGMGWGALARWELV